MPPSPMVVMAAPAPATRYAPREMPQKGSRPEGPSFEERMTQASRSKAEPTSQGATETKPPDTPEQPQTKAEAPAAEEPQTEVHDAQPNEQKAERDADLQPSSAIPAELAAAVMVMPPSPEPRLPQAAPEPAAPEQAPLSADLSSATGIAPSREPQVATALQASVVPRTNGERKAVSETASTAVSETEIKAVSGAGSTAVSGTESTAVNGTGFTAGSGAEIKAVNGTGFTAVSETAIKAVNGTESMPDAMPIDPEAPLPAETAKPTVAVKPVASQTVPSSLEGLRAEKGLMSLRESLDGAPRTETTPAPARTQAMPVPSSLDEVTATVVEEAAPEAPAVKPWEIAEPVRVVSESPAAKTETPLKLEPVPVKEAITRTFMQLQKSPDRPAELRLQLNPEHLGRMDVRVQAQDGAVSAVIRVEHAGVRDMVENQLAALRTTLAEQGIKIDRLEVSVNQQGPRDQQQASAGFEFGRQAFGQQSQADSGQSQQGQARSSPTGRTPWESAESGEGPQDLAGKASGFDARA